MIARTYFAFLLFVSFCNIVKLEHVLRFVDSWKVSHGAGFLCIERFRFLLGKIGHVLRLSFEGDKVSGLRVDSCHQNFMCVMVKSDKGGNLKFLGTR